MTVGFCAFDSVNAAWQEIARVQDAKGCKYGPWNPSDDPRDPDTEAMQEVYDAIQYQMQMWGPRFSALYRPGYFTPDQRAIWGRHEQRRRDLVGKLKNIFTEIAELQKEWAEMVHELDNQFEP